MSISNAEILSTIASNPELGFRMLMQQYGEPIYHHIRRLVVSHDDTQDIMQETFLKVFRSIDSLKDQNALTPWIYRIATREALTALRQRKHPTEILDIAADGTNSIKSDTYVDYSDIEAVHLQKAILSLPEKQRLTFNLRYYDEMEYPQIAETLGITVSTAKVNYHLAKEKIIKYMNSINLSKT